MEVYFPSFPRILRDFFYLLGTTKSASTIIQSNDFFFIGNRFPIEEIILLFSRAFSSIFFGSNSDMIRPFFSANSGSISGDDAKNGGGE